MLPHIVIRGIGILPRRCERTPSWISPGEPPFRNLFLKPLRLCPSHGVAERQPSVSMGMNCEHNPDVPPCAGLFPGLFPLRCPLAAGQNSAGATPARHLQEHDHPPLILPSWGQAWYYDRANTMSNLSRNFSRKIPALANR
jgi:hypothetical protein